MVSDFFHPKIGGVESHIIHLSHQLVKLGHTVIVVTHAYPDFIGVHYIGCLKVYYLPTPIVYQGCTFPAVIANISFLGKIFYEEDVDIVHGHQSSSTLALEGCIDANLMGIRTTFTDHSLFSWRLNGPVFLNKCCRYALPKCQALFCVSETSKANICLRGWLDPSKCHVIPNAIINEDFTPDPQPATINDVITVVVVSRLVYRKGTDLLIKVIPIICKSHPKINFLVAGDGEKRIELEQMIDQYLLFDRVTLLGAVSLGKVREVLVQGSIFLNTSLTEAFCIAILEAASCGLLVVSTNVGGIPEVLPNDMVRLGEPNSLALIEKMEVAINDVLEYRRVQQISCFPTYYDRLKEIYSWERVAKETADIYETLPEPMTIEEMVEFHSEWSVYSMLCMMTLMGSWIMMQITLAFLDQKKIKVKHLKYSKTDDSFWFDEYELN